MLWGIIDLPATLNIASPWRIRATNRTGANHAPCPHLYFSPLSRRHRSSERLERSRAVALGRGRSTLSRPSQRPCGKTLSSVGCAADPAADHATP